MEADHKLRPECAREFGRLQAEADAHKEFRKEVRESLAQIVTATNETKELVAGHVGEADGGWERIEILETAVSNIQDKMWGERLKTGGMAAAGVGAIQLIIEILRTQT